MLTDNRNRTAGEVRHIFARHDGNLAESGAVAWLFERKGVILVDAGSTDEDELTLAAADAGAEDVREEGSSYEVTCAPEDLHAVREALEAAGIAVTDAEATMLPKTTIAIEDETTAQQGAEADRRAGGERRRPGGLRELRHPGARPGGGRGLDARSARFAGGIRPVSPDVC